LTRLLELASASTVEASRLQTLRTSLSAAIARQRALERTMNELRERVASRSPSASTEEDGLLTAVASAAAGSDTLRDQLGLHLVRFDVSARRIEELTGGLFAEILRSRMRPFSEGTIPFPRMVRDLARQLGKRVEFRLEGEHVLVDREILRKLEAPLTHMLRNSIDHGIEPPDARRAAGKPETASLILQARHESGALVVEVRDDGRGIDPESVRRRIVDRSMVDEATAARMQVSELMDFLFLPGFSTKTEVTEISGRGVGLDVVQSMVHAVSGAVSVQTEPGRGIRFTMRLPVSLSVVRAAIAEAAGALLAFPLSRLAGVETVPARDIAPVQGRLRFERQGRAISLLHAGEILELPGAPTQRDPVPVVLLHIAGDLVGVVVDRLLGEEDVAVRPLDPRLGQVPHITATALRGDGEPVLMVDVDDLARSLRESLRGGRTRGLSSLGARSASAARRILVVDDSITVREVERQLLQRRGHHVDVAVDGRDGFNALRTHSYDLLVTDVDMPRMNGLELVRAVRREPRLAALPIVIVSYKDRDSDRLAGLDAGANAYLTKGSFQDDSFTSTIEDLLAGGGA
jgi:two-component system sensor histidine kinase and response regulator WspE